MCLIETFLKSKFIPMAILFSCSYGISIEPLEFWMILPRKENEYGKTNEKWFGHMFNDELFDLTRQGKTRKLTREFHCVERVLTVKLAEEAHAISNTCFRPMPCYTFQFFFYSPPSKKKKGKTCFFNSFLADQGRKMKIEFSIWPESWHILIGSEVGFRSTSVMNLVIFEKVM